MLSTQKMLSWKKNVNAKKKCCERENVANSWGNGVNSWEHVVNSWGHGVNAWENVVNSQQSCQLQGKMPSTQTKNEGNPQDKCWQLKENMLATQRKMLATQRKHAGNSKNKCWQFKGKMLTTQRKMLLILISFNFRNLLRDTHEGQAQLQKKFKKGNETVNRAKSWDRGTSSSHLPNSLEQTHFSLTNTHPSKTRRKSMQQNGHVKINVNVVDALV